jgi:putative nucleotidyltransferase with HDIG domain
VAFRRVVRWVWVEITRDNGWTLLREYVTDEALIRHCLAVEAAMRYYAEQFGEDPERWGFVGLIHDFDFQIHPTLDEHPALGAPLLRDRGLPEDVIQDVLSHADHLGLPRTTRLQLTLAAVDELSSFVVAVALVRPNKSLDEVEPRSVRKKMKDKAFARAVDREAMLAAAVALGIDFDDHVSNVVEALKPVADRFGLVSATYTPAKETSV